MPLVAPIELSGAEKLEILRGHDRYRKWHSLDDKRYCLACGQIIEGRDILVVGGTRGNGPLRLICPTRNCHSITMDWVIPSDEVLARMSMLQEENSLPSLASTRPREKSFRASAQVHDAVSSGSLSSVSPSATRLRI